MKKISIPEEVRSPIDFDPSVNNREPPSGWKSFEVSSDINSTEQSLPPVWYLEKESENDNFGSASEFENSAPTYYPISSASTVSPETSTDLIKTSNTLEARRPRAHITTAMLARLCLFENICSTEAAEEFFQMGEILNSDTLTTTIRSKTKPPDTTTSKPKNANPWLLAQIQACIQDPKYCNFNTFNEARENFGPTTTPKR